jgi:isopropylmalate/homocitrate/citramalate synthase
MFTIINKIGLNEFKAFFDGDNLARLAASFKGGKTAEKAIEEVGISVFIELVSIILGNLPKCENDIFNMLANTSDLTVEQVRKLDMAEFAEMIMDFVKKEEFADFIKVVSKLFK